MRRASSRTNVAAPRTTLTAVVAAHAWGRRRTVMSACRWRGVVTPGLAQHAGVLPNCERQHD